MSRPPSTETQLRAAKRELKAEHSLRLQIAGELSHCRNKLRQAETEAAEWKARFDLLLKRTPESLK